LIPRNLILDKLKEACELVVIDFPKASDKHFSLEAISECDLVLVATTATVRGCASAKRSIAGLAGYARNVELVVRNVPGSNLDPMQIAGLLNTPLAGALELEFNQEQACVTAQEFGTTNFGTTAHCVADSASIEILLSEPNPNRIFSVFMPNIQASSRAGIASDD
jgi:CO dehydrogenase nickel-insertion accessory protein CooC1